MFYYNLVEDEKEARAERQGINLALILIIIGAGFLWFSWKKRKI